MNWLSRTAARLMPAERRDWAEAMWAEADEVAPGLARLAWRAGGLRLIAREALLMRRAGRSLVFAAAAAWVTWAAWPGPAGNPATAVARVDVVTVLLVLTGLPLLARWLFGPTTVGPMARVLRAGTYAAVLVLTVAKASVEQVLATHGYLQPLAYNWLVETIFLLIVAGYVAAILVMTARRPRVAPATLAIGAGAGIMLGVVMCAVAPLGLTNDATEPWLGGSAIDPVVALAWILLLGGPVVAGGIAGWRYRGPGSPEEMVNARVWQGVAAGFLTTGVGALIVTVLGTGTVALMPRAGWLLRWLYPGQRLGAAVEYHRELAASMNVSGYATIGYGWILLAFPIIGLVLGVLGSAWANNVTSGDPGSPPGGGGPPGLEPAQDRGSELTEFSGRAASPGAGPPRPRTRPDAGAPGWAASPAPAP
jgi:hypothetical protein